MAKITISRIFETARALATEAGGQLQDFIQFQAQFAEITIRALRNGLTDEDNTDCTIRVVELTDNVPLVIAPTAKRAREVRVRRLLTSTTALSAPLAWGFTNNGSVTMTGKFSPTPTAPVQVEIIILY
jgi:hypothetical protein